MNFEQIKQENGPSLRRAETVDIPTINNLLQENLGKNLSTEERVKEGFVTFEPSQEVMEELINNTGVFLSFKNSELKGYFITASPELARKIPFFTEMIEKMESMIYEDRKIKDYKYGLLAQINIAKKYRKGFTFFKLHAFAQAALKEQGYELGIGEVADENKNSLAVHRNLEDVGTYISDNGIKWHVLIADFRNE